jgi:hypothetical protein
MKIGIDFQSLEDCANLFWCVNNFKFEILTDNSISFSNDEDTFIFSKGWSKTPSDNIKDCDIKIRAYHTFQEWKNYEKYDFLIQSQLVENYHIYNNELKEFLDAGNICLSSASISFDHPNFYFEPFFNLNYFYYFYGINYLNYYKSNINKLHFIGTYHRENNKSWRDLIYNNVKMIVENDISTFKNNTYNLKKLLEPYGNNTFQLWGMNHISSYIDYKTSVCNLIFETMQEDGNNEEQDTRMFGRRYITEKTLKAIAFGEEEIFFIWYGPQDLYEYLKELGFWFYNSEFYNGDIRQSVYDASKELKKLKIELGTNDAVYNYLKENYVSKLENNVSIFKKMLEVYYKSNNVINLLKNGKRN